MVGSSRPATAITAGLVAVVCVAVSTTWRRVPAGSADFGATVVRGKSGGRSVHRQVSAHAINLKRRANAHDGLHVVGVLRIDHRVGRLVGHPGQRVAVLLAHRWRGDDAVAEGRGQFSYCFFDRHRVAGMLRTGELGNGHKTSPLLSPLNGR